MKNNILLLADELLLLVYEDCKGKNLYHEFVTHIYYNVLLLPPVSFLGLPCPFVQKIFLLFFWKLHCQDIHVHNVHFSTDPTSDLLFCLMFMGFELNIMRCKIMCIWNILISSLNFLPFSPLTSFGFLFFLGVGFVSIQTILFTN
jgi:hypothetical protein